MTASRQPVKARLRAPFGGFSRTTPVPLRHLIPRGGGCLFSLHAHDVVPPSIAGMLRLPTEELRRPDHHPRLVSECILCLTGTPGPFSTPRRTILCTGPRAGLCVVSLPPAPVPPRRIAMRCSRGGTEVILSQVLRAGMKGGEIFLRAASCLRAVSAQAFSAQINFIDLPASPDASKPFAGEDTKAA